MKKIWNAVKAILALFVCAVVGAICLGMIIANKDTPTMLIGGIYYLGFVAAIFDFGFILSLLVRGKEFG